MLKKATFLLMLLAVFSFSCKKKDVSPSNNASNNASNNENNSMPLKLHKNGVTIIATEKAKVGETYELNGKKYKVVDNSSLKKMVESGANVTHVVTTRVDNMNKLFFWEDGFNQDISSWDVSNVKNMSRMFDLAEKFNQDISHWDVSNVTNMSSLFYNAKSFNQDISSWDTSGATNLSRMFSYATKFNQDISAWNVSNATKIEFAFYRSGMSSSNKCKLKNHSKHSKTWSKAVSGSCN